VKFSLLVPPPIHFLEVCRSGTDSSGKHWWRGAGVALVLFAGSAGFAAEPARDSGDKPATGTRKPADMVVNADLAAEKAARRFLEACAASDWDTVRELWSGKLDDRVKTVLGGLEIFSVGEAESNRIFPGTRQVPYDIRFKRDGRHRKQKLNLKQDKQTGRWIVDGGI